MEEIIEEDFESAYNKEKEKVKILTEAFQKIKDRLYTSSVYSPEWSFIYTTTNEAFTKVNNTH